MIIRSFRAAYEEERRARGVTMETYAKQLKNIFQNKFDLDFELQVVFVDTHYNKSNYEELMAFTQQVKKITPKYCTVVTRYKNHKSPVHSINMIALCKPKNHSVMAANETFCSGPCNRAPL